MIFIITIRANYCKMLSSFWSERQTKAEGTMQQETAKQCMNDIGVSQENAEYVVPGRALMKTRAAII